VEALGPNRRPRTASCRPERPQAVGRAAQTVATRHDALLALLPRRPEALVLPSQSSGCPLAPLFLQATAHRLASPRGCAYGAAPVRRTREARREDARGRNATGHTTASATRSPLSHARANSAARRPKAARSRHTLVRGG